MKPLRRLGTLEIALAVSLLAHAGLLTLRFVAPQHVERLFRDQPLEVILVNSHDDDRPERALAVAQANLAGGGDDASGRAASPLPPAVETRRGDATEEQEQRSEERQPGSFPLLARLAPQPASVVMPDRRSSDAEPAEQERERKRQDLVRILSEVERHVNTSSAGPRKHYISPATREAWYAQYYGELRRRIEERGTADFPEADGRKLYGELAMLITVNHDGRVLATEIVQGSGQAELDRQAQAIVRGLSFGHFDATMRRHADQVVVASRFSFTRDQTLQTREDAR
ncbi:MAG: hypothetical protein RJA36_3623 [Pseudomonadota bacterium]